MQLSHLIKLIEDQTDEELLIRLQELRQRRETDRPVAKAKIAKEKKKKSTKTVTVAEKILADLSPEELEALLKEFNA